MTTWVRSAVSLIFLAVPALVAADDPKTPPDGWKEVTGGYKGHAYAVWMPKAGKIDASEDSILVKTYGQIRVFRTVSHPKGGPLYAAGQIILPPSLTKAPAKVRQDLLRDMFLEEFKGKLLEEKKVKLGTMAGREYLAETPDGLARFRLLGTGVQIFRVAVAGTKKQMKSKDVDMFFDSFKRTPAKTDKKDK